MTAQRCGAANLDRGHDAPLGEAQMRLVGGAPSGAVAAEDTRHFELWTRHCRVSVRPCRCQVQVFERALDLPDQVDGNAGSRQANCNARLVIGPMARGGLAHLAMARLKSAGVPVGVS